MERKSRGSRRAQTRALERHKEGNWRRRKDNWRERGKQKNGEREEFGGRCGVPVKLRKRRWMKREVKWSRELVRLVAREKFARLRNDVWFEFGGGVTAETSGIGFNYVNVFLHWTGGLLNEGRRHGVLLQNGAELQRNPMVSRRRMAAAGSLVGRDLGRFRFVERDARLRVQSRSLPVTESHLPIDVSGPGHPAGASSLRDIVGTNVSRVSPVRSRGS
ncbi:hypothetical protein K0M31_000608 [Melipona bicolor]|uniref:Uncharacterized protein n=1 Tax=Melipona bicolor TaxID=60889 RepID=A0AA40KWU4_9HYME|nr:hypothetical protein K0M31_000608 [Melipona bicolor]